MAGRMLNPYEMTKLYADRGLANQVRKENDYIGLDGLLWCGTCNQPRQGYLEVPNPTEEDPANVSSVLVAVECNCDKEAEERAAKKKHAEKDMEIVNRLRNASLIDEKLKNASFDSFVATKFNERNLKLALRYSTGFDEMLAKNQGLIFWGDVGTGKSYMAACIANYLLEKKIPVIMTSFVKILDLLQDGHETDSGFLNRLNMAKLVIFDDLGAERDTSFALEKVYNIIDSRSRRNLPMILTTNLTIDQMKEELDVRYKRIYDRIFETCYPMQFAGPSWRRVEANRRFVEMGKLLGD